MGQDDYVDAFAELLRNLGRKNSLRDPLAGSLHEYGFTAPQLHALMWLGADGPLTMGELARRVGTTEKTITGIVDRLEREDYAKRSRSEDDRRVVHTQLTKKGRAAFTEIDAEVRNRLGVFLALLGDQDRRDLFRILENLIAKLDVQYLPVAVKPAATK